MALPIPCICLVTDQHRLRSATADELLRLAASAAAAGVDLIHIRERSRDDREMLSLTRRIVAGARATRAQVVVNDRTDIAVASAAAGVHLRADSVGADRVRRIVPSGFLVGRSVHSVEEAVRAASSGVDYLVMGTVYSTKSKSDAHPLAGVEALREVCRAVSVPVLAIGGVTTDKLADIVAAGAAGVAAIGLFSDAFNDNREDPEGALAEIVGTMREAFRAHPTNAWRSCP